jgi:hypothetical protein
MIPNMKFAARVSGTRITFPSGPKAETMRNTIATLMMIALAAPSHGAARTEAGERSDPPTAWESFAGWRRWGEWKREAVAGYAVDYLYSGVLVRRNTARAAFFGKLGFAYLGADVEYAAFKGELPDSVPQGGTSGNLGWGVSVGADFLRYRLGSAPYALPEHFWAERDLEAKYFARGADGSRVVRLFEKDAAPSLEHRVEARFGALRYALTFSPGAYKAPLHFAALDGLPGGFGTWGMGALLVPGDFIPGIWYRMRDFEVARVRIGGTPRALRFVPCRITYFRAVRSQFRLAWNGEAALDL